MAHFHYLILIIVIDERLVLVIIPQEVIMYLSDGERGGERHFVGKAEAETGEGDAPFPRLGVATVHLVVNNGHR